MFSPPRMGLALFALAILSFSSWVTCHAILCVLLVRLSLARGLIAFLIFPLAPYYAATFPRTRRLWVILLAVYGIALIAGFNLPGR